MGNAFWFDWEPKVIIFIQNILNPILEKIAEIITFFGDEYAMILILGFLYWGYKKDLGKKIATYAITALISSVALNNIVMRRRPYFDHADIRCVKPRASGADPYDLTVQGYSFPSGHATNCVSTYAALALNVSKKILKVLLFVLVFLVGLSRIALGVHYPTDILAGWLISALFIFIISHIKNPYVVYSLIAAIGIIGCFFSKSTDYYSSLGIAFGFIAGFIFEDKIVKFKNTKNVFRMILRTLGGLVIFLVLDTLLKLPFSADFLAMATMPAFLVRAARYAVASFIVIGVYPLLFAFVDKKILSKRKTNEK